MESYRIKILTVFVVVVTGTDVHVLTAVETVDIVVVNVPLIIFGSARI